MNALASHRLREVGALGLLAIALSISQGKALPINGGFESGDLSGWTLDAPLYPDIMGQSSSLGSAVVVNDPAHAHGGDYYVQLINDNPALPVGSYHVALSCTVDMLAGQVLSGWADYSSFDRYDAAWVRILDNVGLVAEPWYGHVNDPSSIYWSSGRPPTSWQYWSWEAPATGTYTVQLGTGTGYDGEDWSYAYFDDIKISASVADTNVSVAQLLMGIASLLVFGQLLKLNRSNPFVVRYR